MKPEHKFGVVRALQHAGCVVGMTGDGVNDAPALAQVSRFLSMPAVPHTKLCLCS